MKTYRKTDLESQIIKTIALLNEKFLQSDELIVKKYLDIYSAALNDLSNFSLYTDKSLIKILDCSRGYLETSSNYKQNFLSEMYLTEKMVKDYLE